jgi:hypothetical protein
MEAVADLFWYLQEPEKEEESDMIFEVNIDDSNMGQVSPLYHFMGEYWE